jgi:hypothetical protein
MMSPYVGGYFPGDEDNLLFLRIALEFGLVVVFLSGQAWDFIWVQLLASLNADFLVLPWLISSFLFGVAIYLLTCAVFIRIYKHSFHNEGLNEIVERAKRKMGYSGTIQFWRYESERYILAGFRTAVYSAILISDRALRSILENPSDGEVVIASKITGWPRFGALTRFLRIGLLFLAPAVFLPILFDASLLYYDPAFGPSLVPFGVAASYVFFSMLRDWMSRPYTIHEVEALYGTPLSTSFMMLFVGPATSQKKVQKYVENYKVPPNRQDIIRKRNRLLTSLCGGAVVGSIPIFQLVASGALTRHPEFILLAAAFSLGLGGACAVMIFGFQFDRSLLHEWDDIRKGRARNKLQEKKPVSDVVRQETAVHDGTPCSESEAREIEMLLSQAEGYEGYHVKCEEKGEDSGSFVVYRPGGYNRANWVCTIPSELHKLMPSADMMVPHIIYGSTVERVQRKQVKYILPIILPAFVVSFLLGSIFRINLTGGAADVIFSGMLSLVPFLLVMLLAGHRWYKSIMFKADAELARMYPAHIAALEALTRIGGIPELGVPSVEDRLRHLQNATHENAGEHSQI